MVGRLPAVDESGSARYRSRVPAHGPVPCAGNEVVPRKQLFRPCGERAFFVSVDLMKGGMLVHDGEVEVVARILIDASSKWAQSTLSLDSDMRNLIGGA